MPIVGEVVASNHTAEVIDPLQHSDAESLDAESLDRGEWAVPTSGVAAVAASGEKSGREDSKSAQRIRVVRVTQRESLLVAVDDEFVLRVSGRQT